MKLLDMIDIFCIVKDEAKRMICNKINMMKTNIYNLYTGFPQNLWKTRRTSFLLKGSMIFMCLFLFASCTYVKSFKTKPAPTLDSSLISMNEEDVRKKLGEPTVVSMTPENTILWTYYPEWKMMPDNKDTVYLEFEKGKVIKATKAKK